jgi:two-component system cell cycle response regulator
MNILIACDDPGLLQFLDDALADSDFQVTTARDGLQAARLLSAPDGPPLAILDAVLPGMEGADVCRAARATLRERKPYLIMLGAGADAEASAQAIEAGADDCIGRPFQAHELQLRVQAGRRIAELEDELRFRATRDALTNIYNRGTIMDVLHKEVARHQRSHLPLSIIFCDLDHFKDINDTLGHLAGDAVLCEVTRRLNALLRPYDAFGRYGGEELMCVLPDCALAGALEVAERMRAAVADAAIVTDTGAVAVTVSIGVASMSREEVSSLPAFLQRADHALRRAKQNGRNCVNIGSL